MSKRNMQLIFGLAIIICVTLTLTGCKKQPAPKKQVEQSQIEDNNKPSSSVQTGESPIKPVKPEAVIANPKTSLMDVIRSARTWRPAYTSWFGQKAPDFTLTDITGKQHKLSNYYGKNVLIIFWATWCAPCKVEIPHLIALRNLIGEDKLAMLAVSYITTFPPETTKKVKEFVKKNKINYTVFSVDVGDMPAPYSQVRSIPCSFFIDSEGKIKMATEGLLSLGAIKAILQAE